MAIKFIWLGCSLGGAARSFRLMSARADWSTCPGLRLFLSTIVVERSAPIINPLEIAGELQSSFTGEKYGRNISLRSVGGAGTEVAQFRLNLSARANRDYATNVSACSRLKGSFRIRREDEKSSPVSGRIDLDLSIRLMRMYIQI